jgi:hypothetical protein
MEIKLTETIEKVVNIEFPYYSKSANAAYKVFNEKEMLRVGSYWPEISYTDYGLSSLPFKDDCTQITESEFKELYQITLTKLNEKL